MQPLQNKTEVKSSSVFAAKAVFPVQLFLLGLLIFQSLEGKIFSYKILKSKEILPIFNAIFSIVFQQI